MGNEFDVLVVVQLIFALMFIVIGNLMPKVRQNTTLGIKIKWTLENEENWNRTHRFAGKLWVAGSVVILLTMVLPEKAAYAVMIVDFLIMMVATVLYSYLFYRRQSRDGRYEVNPACAVNQRVTKVSLLIVVLVLIGVVLLMFTGNIDFRLDAESFTVDATYFSDLTVSYAQIDRMELRTQDSTGRRVAGFGSARLNMGRFRNGEFGNYLRYSYTGADKCIVLYHGEEILVLAAKTDAETQALFDALCEKTAP